MPTDATLRELQQAVHAIQVRLGGREIEQSVHKLEIRLTELRTQIDLQFKADAAAREINNKEVGRRLDLLNGEAGKLHLMQATYWPREVAEANVAQTRNLSEAGLKEMRTWCDGRFNDMNSSLAELRDYRANQQGRQAIVAAAVAMLVSFIGQWLFKR